uniref:Uncharacterized protein n=1 Tax=Laticauda laticaudata TaxID=8630 RepID=A0A8C5RND1_LATLA
MWRARMCSGPAPGQWLRCRRFTFTYLYNTASIKNIKKKLTFIISTEKLKILFSFFWLDGQQTFYVRFIIR